MSGDWITMTDDQCLVLHRMDPELGYPFRDIAEDVGIAERACRDIVRGFFATGLASRGILYDQDGEGVKGSGYWLSAEGHAARCDMIRYAGISRLYRMRDERQAASWAALTTPTLTASGERVLPLGERL